MEAPSNTHNAAHQLGPFTRFVNSVEEICCEVILKVYTDQLLEKSIDVPITPSTTCTDIIECVQEPGDTPRYLAELWRGSERVIHLDESPYEILTNWAQNLADVTYFIRYQPHTTPIPGTASHRLNMKDTHAAWIPPISGGSELTMPELREIAARQQQQIENQQHILLTKEQRLKYLKEEARRQQQAAGEHDRLRKLKENVKAQELKLRKLRALRGEVEQNKLNNGNLNSELESIKALFNEKEKELSIAVMKVDELSRQLEDYRQGRFNGLNKMAVTSEQDIKRLKMDLAMRNKLNDQQSMRLAAEKETLLQRKEEISRMDKRIHELQQRLKKRRQLQQMAKQQNETNTAGDLMQDVTNGANVYRREGDTNDGERTGGFDKSDTKYKTLPYSIKLSEQDLRGIGASKLGNHSNVNIPQDVKLIGNAHENDNSNADGSKMTDVIAGNVSERKNKASLPQDERAMPKLDIPVNSTNKQMQYQTYGQNGGLVGNNITARPYGMSYSSLGPPPRSVVPLPTVNIHEEPRPGGSGQSSPANSDNSLPGKVENHKFTDSELHERQNSPDDGKFVSQPPPLLQRNQFNVPQVSSLNNGTPGTHHDHHVQSEVQCHQQGPNQNLQPNHQHTQQYPPTNRQPGPQQPNRYSQAGYYERKPSQSQLSAPFSGSRYREPQRTIHSSSSESNIQNKTSQPSNTTNLSSHSSFQQNDHSLGGRRTPSHYPGMNHEVTKSYEAYINKPANNHHYSGENIAKSLPYDSRQSTASNNHLTHHSQSNQPNTGLKYGAHQPPPRSSVSAYNQHVPPQSQNGHAISHTVVPRQPPNAVSYNTSHPSSSQQQISGRYTPSNVQSFGAVESNRNEMSNPQVSVRDVVSTVAPSTKDHRDTDQDVNLKNTNSTTPSMLTPSSYKAPIPTPRQVQKNVPSTEHIEQSTVTYRSNVQSENKDIAASSSMPRPESFINKTAVDGLNVRDGTTVPSGTTEKHHRLPKVYSPMKNAPQFASKSVIANTYTQKLGAKAMEQYRKNMMLLYKDQEIVKSTEELDRPSAEKSESSSVSTNSDAQPVTKAMEPEVSSSDSNPVSTVKAMSSFFNRISNTSENCTNKSESETESKPAFVQYASDKASNKVMTTPKQLRRRHSDVENTVEDPPKNEENAEMKTESKEEPEVVEIVVKDSDQIDSISVPPGEPQVIDDLKAAMERKFMTDFTVKSAQVDNDQVFGPPYSTQVIRRRKPKVKETQKHTRRVSFDPLALLLDAALEGELDLVERSAKEVDDVSTANDEGITALHNAICAGHTHIVEFLVGFGADVNSADSDGWTPLHCAASCNNLPMVELLVDHGACIFATTISDHETAAEKCEEYEDGYDGCSEYLYSIQEKLGITNGGAVYAVFAYDAVNDDEITFKVGDKMTVIKKGDDTEKEWWWATLGDCEGYIPRNLLGLHPRKPKHKVTDNSDT